MGNFLNKSSPIPHTRLIPEESSLELGNMGSEPAVQQIESTSRIKNIYNWIAENKTFCATVTAGACLVGYLGYLYSQKLEESSDFNKMNQELLCALNTFAKGVYDTVPNIKDMEMWQNLTTSVDKLLENYPKPVVDKIRSIVTNCKALKPEGINLEDVTPTSL